MKKIQIILSIVILMLLGACSKTSVDAELKYEDENKIEQVYIIKKTDNLEEVKKLAQIIKNKKIDTSFNGVKIILKSDLEGKVIVQASEKRTIDLGYTLDVDAITNLKKYGLEGTLELKGYTNTESASLSLKTQNQLSADVVNDDNYLYMLGNMKTGNTQIKVKHKLSIRNFTEDYKAGIISCLDVLKYYKISELVSNLEELVELYNITIVETTKDTFTLRLNVPSQSLFPDLESKESIPADIVISCERLLPLEFNFSLDQLISQALHTEYANKYLSDKVIVETAKGNISLKLEYGNYTIKTLSEEEKIEYKDYKKES